MHLEISKTQIIFILSISYDVFFKEINPVRKKLQGKIKKVRVSTRLNESPVCFISLGQEMDPYLSLKKRFGSFMIKPLFSKCNLLLVFSSLSSASQHS